MLKKIQKFSVIILVFNILFPRFTSNERRLLELFYNIAPGTPIHRHLAIVWTHCDPKLLEALDIALNIRKRKFYQFIEKYLILIPKEEITSIPQYFIDSKIARNKNSDDHKDLGVLLAWVQNIPPFQKIGIPRPKILEKVNNNIFILPKNRKEIELIGDIGVTDRNKEYNLIPDEIPVDTEIIIKREILEVPKNSNIFYCQLTTINSDKINKFYKFLMEKKKFAQAFAKNENEFYPLY